MDYGSARVAGPLLASIILIGCPGGGDGNTDGGGGGGANRPPSAISVAIGPRAASTAEMLEATVTGGEDPDGDTLTTTFKWFKDGQVQPGLTTARVPASETARDQVWRVEVSVSDGKAPDVTGSDELTIQNAVPSVSVSIQPAAPGRDDDLTATTTVTDPDGDMVTLNFRWQVDTAVSPRTGETIPSTDTEVGQRWVVTVTPNDGTFEGDAATAEVVIGNAPPSIASVTLGPDPATAGDTLIATANMVSDPDGDNVALSYEWTIDGQVEQTGPMNTLAPGRARKTQSVVVRVTPNDGSVDGPSVTSNTLTLTNSIPLVERVMISPATGNETTVFDCMVVRPSDADGDMVNSAPVWFVNGARVSGMGFSSMLTGAAFDRGDAIRCEATPNDGEEDGATVSSSTVTIGNAPPSVASVTISPMSPRESDVITSSVSGIFDADGDPVSVNYVWAVNGVTTSTATQIDGGSFDKGNSITLTVIPRDGMSQGAPVTSGIVVGANTLPTLASVSISPIPPTALTDLMAMPTGFMDPDPVDVPMFDFQWTVNGMAVPGATMVTLMRGMYRRGDVVSVTATPRDSSGTGPSVSSATVAVGNAPPTAPTVSISPISADSNDDLNCTITSASMDPDSDPITYRYEWFANGLATTITTSIAPAAQVRGRQQWLCRAFGNDGLADSPPGSASVYVADACSAVRLDGVDDNVIAPASSAFNYGDAATVEAWVRFNGTTANAFDSSIFTHRPASNAMTIGVFQNDTATDACVCPGRRAGQAYFRWSGACSSDMCLNGPALLTANQWTHIAGVYNNGTATLFINGVSVATTTSAVALQALPVPSSMAIGSLADNSGAFFPGEISEVRVSTAAVYLGNFSPAAFLTTDSRSVAHWRFDEAVGTAVNDATGGPHTGTLNGGARVEIGPACTFSPVDVATRFSQALCAHRARCEPAFFGFLGNDQQTCVSENTASNTLVYSAFRQIVDAGRMRFDEAALNSCLQAYSNVDCERGLELTTCEFFAGLRQVGQECGVTNECVASAYCPVSGFGSCAACTSRSPRQGTCATVPCGAGDRCLNVNTAGGVVQQCIAVTADLGEACGTVATGLCRGRLQCVGGANGTCRRAAGPGQACDPMLASRSDCNIFMSQGCAAGQCQLVSWNGAGGSCATPARCNNTATCNNMTQVCDALPIAGQPCVQNTCAPGHYCASGTCQAERAQGAACAAANECGTDLFCIDSACENYRWTSCP